MNTGMPLLDQAMAICKDQPFERGRVRQTAILWRQAKGYEKQCIGRLLEAWGIQGTDADIAWMHDLLDEAGE